MHGVLARFFDHFLKDEPTGVLDEPRVRIEVRSDATTVHAVYGADTWPPAGVTWRTLALDGRDRSLGAEAAARPEAPVTFDTRRGEARFTWTVSEALEVVGPASVRLHVAVDGAPDVFVVAGLRKRRRGRVVAFEGSYGYDRDLVTHGMLKASLRRTDPARSQPGRPWHPCTAAEPLAPGEVVAVDVALNPSATAFAAGDELELVVRGRWFFPPTRSAASSPPGTSAARRPGARSTPAAATTPRSPSPCSPPSPIGPARRRPRPRRRGAAPGTGPRSASW